MCKLVAPYHVVNEPRMLDCGSSACFQCIITSRDAERNIKCPYCSSVHKIPADANKLIVNKNLQNFLKINFRQINQLEDSMLSIERNFSFFLLNIWPINYYIQLKLKEKIQNQNVSMENFDQYLTLVQNDVQMKVETMKNHLEKYGEQFVENLKTIRKEVQKFDSVFFLWEIILEKNF